MGQNRSCNKNEKKMEILEKLYINSFAYKKRKWFHEFEKCIYVGSNKKIMKMLLNQISVSETFDDENNNLLHYIATVKNDEITYFLIKAGCKVNHVNKHGNLPIVNAIRFNNVEAVKIFLKSEATVNHNNFKRGFGPLHRAAKKGNLEIVKLLLEAGADVNASSNDKETPLHEAIKPPSEFTLKCKDDYRLAKLLIESGSKLDLIDGEGKTCLHYAIELLKPNIVKLLLENGASIDVADRNDLDPLCYKLESWIPFIKTKDIIATQIECIELLLKYKANVNRVNKDGITPLHFALSVYNSDYVVELLLNHGMIIDFNCSKLNNTTNQLNIKPETLRLVIKYTAMFIEQGKNNKVLNFDLKKLNKQSQDYYKLCKNELETMKTSITFNSSLFFRILSGEAVPRYTQNETIVKSFDHQGYVKIKFPIYYKLLKNCFIKDNEKQILLQNASKGLKRVLALNENSLSIVFDNILRYLDNQDLKSLTLV